MDYSATTVMIQYFIDQQFNLPYRLPFDTLSEYPWLQQTRGSRSYSRLGAGAGWEQARKPLAEALQSLEVGLRGGGVTCSSLHSVHLGYSVYSAHLV